MNKDPQELVITLADQIITLSNEGNKAQASKILETLYAILKEFPHILWNSVKVWKLSKALLIMYHYDVLDKEDENIYIAELAYIYAQRTQELFENSLQENAEDDYFYAIHTQLVLLTTCEDCFTLTVEQFYANSGKIDEKTLQIAHSLASEVMPFVKYSLLEKIESEFDGYRKDAFLEQLCNEIELDYPEISDNKITHGGKIHKMLVNTLAKKLIAG